MPTEHLLSVLCSALSAAEDPCPRILYYCYTQGTKELHVTPKLSLCLPLVKSMHSFIYSTNVYWMLSLCPVRGWGIQDEWRWGPCSSGPCHLVMTVALLFYLSFLAPRCLSMGPHSSDFPGDLNFLEGDLHSPNSLQFIILVPARRYCELLSLRGFITKSRIPVWATRIMDLEKFTEHINFWLPL